MIAKGTKVKCIKDVGHGPYQDAIAGQEYIIDYVTSDGFRFDIAVQVNFAGTTITNFMRFDTQDFDKYFTVAVETKLEESPKVLHCTCGNASVGSPKHSNYCDLITGKMSA